MMIGEKAIRVKKKTVSADKCYDKCSRKLSNFQLSFLAFFAVTFTVTFAVTIAWSSVRFFNAFTWEQMLPDKIYRNRDRMNSEYTD